MNRRNMGGMGGMGIKVTTIDKRDLARWEAYVQASPRTVAWQSHHWSEAVARNYEVEFIPLAAELDGRIRGILPLYQLRAPKAPARLISVPFAVAGGLSADDAPAQQALLEAALALCDERGAAGITFKQYRYPIEGTLKTDSNFFNRELALSLGEAKIWEQLDARNRAAIEAAGRDGLELELEFPSDRVGVFHDLSIARMDPDATGPEDVFHRAAQAQRPAGGGDDGQGVQDDRVIPVHLSARPRCAVLRVRLRALLAPHPALCGRWFRDLPFRPHAGERRRRRLPSRLGRSEAPLLLSVLPHDGGEDRIP
jgi:hypothetical protein